MSMISGYTVKRVEPSGRSVGRRSLATLSVGRRSEEQSTASFAVQNRSKTMLDDITDAFDPNAPAIKVWEHVLLVCLLYQWFVLPYLLSFEPRAVGAMAAELVVCIAAEFIFVVDFYVRAHTGYYSDGNLIRDREMTRQRYFRSYRFATDFVAFLPVQLFVLNDNGMVITMSLMKFIRCVRLPQFVSSLDALYAKHFVLLKLLKVLVSMVYLAHVLACVRFSFGHDIHHDDRWLPHVDVTVPPLHTHYLQSLFWSVGIMTGLFEGELPLHSSEFIFTTLVALCGFSMFTSLVATIFVISKSESGHSEAVEARINQLVHLLSFHKVPENQQVQAIEYLRRYYTDAESNDREAAKTLCRSIANDIQVELLKTTFAQIPIFAGCSEQFIVAMTSLLEMIAVPAQTTLFSAGDEGDAMYIIHSGVLAVIIQSVTVREIRKGAYFGELSVFTSAPRTASVISTTFSILYKLTRFHCERVLDGYPNCAALIAAHVDRTLKRVVNDGHYEVSTMVAIGANSTSVRTTGRNGSISAGLAGTSALLSRVMNGELSARATLASRKSTFEATPIKRRSLVIPTQNDPLNPQAAPTDNHTNVQNLSKPKRPTVSHSKRSLECLLSMCIDHQSRVRLWWLLFLQAQLWYCWLMVPVQIVFPLWQRPSWVTRSIDTFFNIGLYVDIFANFRLSFVADSEKIMDPKRSSRRYLESQFLFDLLCALPYEYLDPDRYGLLRLPRLVRTFLFKNHLSELEHFITLNTRRQLMLLGVLLLMMFHVVACIHFAISYVEGFNSHEEEAWISSINLCLRRVNATHLENCNGTIYDEHKDRSELASISGLEYARSLYYAVGVLGSPGKSVEPVSDVQLIAALILMLSGFLITAIVVDNVQKRFTASAFEQKEFFATSSKIQLFLRRQKAPLTIHHRVKSFLDYWWSSHRGAVIGELLADLPRPVRLDILRSICLPVLQTLALLKGVRLVRDKLEEVMVENVKFILYGQGEIVYRHGDYVTGMFFLLEGEVCLVTAGGPPREVPRGGFFGTAALTQQDRGEGYTEHVSANSGCILLFVSREQLRAMELIFPALKTELLALEHRLLHNKLAKSAVNKDMHARIRRQSTVIKLREALFGPRKKSSDGTVYDPDSTFILAWETWVFVVMTVQWVLVMFQACFSLDGHHKSADALMVFLEASFVIDMYIRSRLGIYEYGNKMMNPHRIRRAYFRSRAFASDIAALLPLYFVNWFLPEDERWDLLNINKLLRLFKVPQQLHALETRYLKRTTELRFFKLLYYIFMLSHVLGCMWFNFASKEAVPNFTTGVSINKITAFGDNHWLPRKELEHAPRLEQYMASLYWSFGLMSASSEPEFPSTTAQFLFSVLTMTTGFFLFAYVIGNFTDIIELTSSESREFNMKMGAVRQMLNHFKLPETLQERLKTFYLFKRFHSITQEHILVHCLPPSLLTDIRLVHLRRMIEKVEFLSGMEGSVTRMLVSQFTQVLISRGEYVCKLGEKSSDMYFVFTGVLDVLLPHGVENIGANGSDRNMSTDHGAQSGTPAKLWRLGVRKSSSKAPLHRGSIHENLRKVNEISAGSYFGENGLFTNGRRNAYIQAQTSCILYKLSRESLELVFDRYPQWRDKVMRIVNIHREQTRLVQLSREEQRRGTDEATGLMLSRADIMNQRAERIKEELQHERSQTSSESHRVMLVSSTGQTLLKWIDEFVLSPLHHLAEGAEVQSSFHRSWLRLMVICILYVSVLTPYQLVMDSLDRPTPVAVITRAFGLICELVFIVDIWFSWHVKESPASMELYEQDLRATYKKERMLWDVVAAIPFHRFLLDFHIRPWLKLMRCLKIFNIVSYLDELNRRSVLYEAARFWYICLLYLLMIYWSACSYLAVSMEVGFSSEWYGWLPSTELEITDPQHPSSAQLARRFLRGLFFATTTFVKKARNLAPDTASLYAFNISLSFVGLITMSFVIGELASLFISFIGLEVDFRKNHIAIELYLERQHVNDQLRARTQHFMTSFWSSHAGVNYQDIFHEMPRPIRTACVLHISKGPVDWFMKKVIAPICFEGQDELDAFRNSMIEHMHFEGYPSNESVVVEGSIARAMYFVLRGHLRLHSRALVTLTRPIGLRRGDFFGERGLLGSAISAFTVRSVRSCDLLSLNSEALVEVIHKHSFAHFALRICECAYDHLKQKNLVACSKFDMEEHWGTAMLEMMNGIRQRHKRSVGASFVTALAKAASKVVIMNGIASAPLERITEASKNTSNGTRGAGTTITSSISDNEIPLHVSKMCEVLATSKDCFAAFSPLLQIILPSDPLDWHASFHPKSVRALLHHADDAVLENPPTVVEKRSWLLKRTNDLSNRILSFHAEDVDESGDPAQREQQDQNEGGRSPEGPANSTLAPQVSFVTRLHVGKSAEKLVASDTLFSMQASNEKSDKSPSFDPRPDAKAPPVHILRQRGTGDVSTKYEPVEDDETESLE